MKLTCIGTGDAFGSGGRLNSCFHLKTALQQILIDCGSSSLIGLERCGINPAEIDTVIISHLHGDHFGGIPYLFLEGKYRSKRTRPLTLIGPQGLENRVETVAHALYPGLSAENLEFSVNYQILKGGESSWAHDLKVVPLPVRHGGGKFAYGLRLELAGKVIAYTGDTEWTEEIISLAQGSDLLITECFSYDQMVPGHLDYRTLLQKKHSFDCRRLVLTHLGPDMLRHRDSLELECVNDGDVLEI